MKSRSENSVLEYNQPAYSWSSLEGAQARKELKMPILLYTYPISSIRCTTRLRGSSHHNLNSNVLARAARMGTTNYVSSLPTCDDRGKRPATHEQHQWKKFPFALDLHPLTRTYQASRSTWPSWFLPSPPTSIHLGSPYLYSPEPVQSR